VGADYLLAVKGNQPGRNRRRSRQRATAASRPAPSRCCDRSIGSTATGAFPGKSASLTRARSSGSKRAEMKDRSRSDVRYSITPSGRSAAELAKNLRGYWGVENTPCTGRST
jgi:hypothetical protein